MCSRRTDDTPSCPPGSVRAVSPSLLCWVQSGSKGLFGGLKPPAMYLLTEYFGRCLELADNLPKNVPWKPSMQPGGRLLGRTGRPHHPACSDDPAWPAPGRHSSETCCVPTELALWPGCGEGRTRMNREGSRVSVPHCPGQHIRTSHSEQKGQFTVKPEREGGTQRLHRPTTLRLSGRRRGCFLVPRVPPPLLGLVPSVPTLRKMGGTPEEPYLCKSTPR